MIVGLAEAIEGFTRDRDRFLERGSVMGDKGQKDKNKGLKQRAAKEAKKEKRRREKQARSAGISVLGR